MKKLVLKAKNRKADSQAKKIRKGFRIPAVLYGKKTKNKHLTLDQKEFEKLIHEKGTSVIVDLTIGSKPTKALIQSIQFHPVSDHVIHVDFYKIRKDEKIHTYIPIETVGKSLAVEENGGNLIIDKNEIEVECLPDDLVEKIEIDITVLKTFDDVIRIEDLNIPQGIEVVDKKEEVVATTTAPRSEEELEALEETPTTSDVDEVEVESEKEDEEEAEEGEKTEGEKETSPNQPENKDQQPEKK